MTGTGESDTYADGEGSPTCWTYGTNLLTQVTGAEPVRLPRAPDLLPPALARWLLDTAAVRTPDPRLPPAGSPVDAAGLPAGPGPGRAPDRLGGDGPIRPAAPRRGPDL